MTLATVLCIRHRRMNLDHMPEKAPMCWVIPPNSFWTTEVFRKASNNVVFPWSTCPMTVTIGCRRTMWAVSAGGLKKNENHALPMWSTDWLIVRRFVGFFPVLLYPFKHLHASYRGLISHLLSRLISSNIAAAFRCGCLYVFGAKTAPFNDAVENLHVADWRTRLVINIGSFHVQHRFENIIQRSVHRAGQIANADAYENWWNIMTDEVPIPL